MVFEVNPLFEIRGQGSEKERVKVRQTVWFEGFGD
jgi:hypothetical protein